MAYWFRSCGTSVARAAVAGTLVEGQEKGFIALEPGGHVDLVLANGEMHQGTAFEGQQRFRVLGDGVYGEAGGLVLHDGILHRLFELGFQLQGGDGDAVDEKHQIDAPGFGLDPRFGEMGLAGPWAVDQFGNHPQPVLLVAGQGVRVEIVLRFELEERKAGAAVADGMSSIRQGCRRCAWPCWRRWGRPCSVVRPPVPGIFFRGYWDTGGRIFATVRPGCPLTKPNRSSG